MPSERAPRRVPEEVAGFSPLVFAAGAPTFLGAAQSGMKEGAEEEERADEAMIAVVTNSKGSCEFSRFP